MKKLSKREIYASLYWLYRLHYRTGSPKDLPEVEKLLLGRIDEGLVMYDAETDTLTWIGRS